MQNSTKHRLYSLSNNTNGKIIDYRFAVAGAVVMSTIVFGINFYGTNNIPGATVAAIKQGLYTFFFAGMIMKGAENLALAIKSKKIAIISACLIPSFVSLTLTFAIHNLKGTPKPVESTIPTAFFVIPSTAIWGYIKRTKNDKNKKSGG